MPWDNLEAELSELFDGDFAYKYDTALEKRSATRLAESRERDRGRIHTPEQRARRNDRARELIRERQLEERRIACLQAKQARQVRRAQQRREKLEFQKRYPYTALVQRLQLRADKRTGKQRRAR